MSERVDINRVLLEMRSIKSQAEAFAKPQQMVNGDIAPDRLRPGVQVEEGQETPRFGEMLEQALNRVNEVQHASGDLAKAYERGDPSVSITDVMVASQKASVSFQSVLQVRNKLLEAYRDVMNMPI